jgi:membrane protein implicated in regulation of membrane protease activity
MVTRAGILFLSAMIGAAALLGGLPMGPVLLLTVTLTTVLWATLRDSSINRHRSRARRLDEPPRRLRGDCRDLMGHEEPPVQRDEESR